MTYKCPYCGIEKKAKGTHERKCSNNPANQPHDVNDLMKIMNEKPRTIKPPEPVLKEEIPTPKTGCSTAPETAVHEKKWYQFWKKTGLSTKQIKEMRLNQPKLTDEEKFLRFFGNLPKWTTKKPGWYRSWKIGDRLRHCVLVSRDPKKQDVELFLEYNKEIGLLQTENSFYDMPIKEKGTIYLDADRFRPLINGNDYSSDFDIPEDFANSLLNRGIKFGQLAQFKAVLDKIDKMMIITWLLGGLLVLSIIVNILTVHSGNNAIHDLSGQIGNLTSIVNSMRPP